MRGTRGTLLAPLVAVLMAGVAQGAPMPPDKDPFYAPPPGLSGKPPGTILRSRQVDVQIKGFPPSAVDATAYQLLYRTNDAKDKAVANATTVIVPSDAKGELISVNDAEDSLDSTCAPSYQLQVGEPDNGNLAIEMTMASHQLERGRTLVVPDAEGPESQYIVTGMEGHATLDSIRAAERFAPARLDGAKTPAALIGYSGGAHVTAAASELQPSYAPELNLVGVAAGGVPVGDRETVDYLDGSIGASLLIGTGVAVDRAFPELDLDSLLNEKGKALAEQVSKGCATSVFAAPFAHMDDFTVVPHVYDIPRVAKIIADNALGHAAPKAPTFFYNAVHDELVTISSLDKLVAKYCARGTPMTYYRDQAGAEHIQGVANFFPLAVAYLEARFAGQSPPPTCGLPSVS